MPQNLFFEESTNSKGKHRTERTRKKNSRNCSNQNINNLLICKYRIIKRVERERGNFRIVFSVVFLLTKFGYWFLFCVCVCVACARALYVQFVLLRLFCLLKNKYLFNMFSESTEHREHRHIVYSMTSIWMHN